MRCGACKGEGTQAGYTDQGDAMRCVLEECDRCGGSGEVCATCEGKGYRFRTPYGFNPFSAGGWNTIKAMYRVPCRDCRGASKNDYGGPKPLTAFGGELGETPKESPLLDQKGTELGAVSFEGELNE